MKRIVILGGSAAGVKAIEEIRRTDSSSEIMIISFDGHYPNKRDMFASFIANEIVPEEVFYRSKDFYEQHNVNVVLDKKISRINVKRKRIFTEDKKQIDYDVLIITDTPENRFPDIKGTNKGGIFGYKKLKDIDQIVNALSLIETVVVQSDSFSGLGAALAFAKRKKEVILISSENSFLTKHFETEALEWLVGAFEEKGLRIMQANTISEILGDKDAKAVRLKSGKVFAAEMVLFGEINEDLRLFSNSGLQMNQRIDVNANFKTKAEDLFVVDQACSLSDSEPVTPLSVLEDQGKVVAAAICGQEQPFRMSVCLWNLNAAGLVMTVMGQAEVKEGITVRRTFDRELGTYKGLYIEDNRLVGAVLVNAEGEKDELLRLINEKTDIDPGQEKELSSGELSDSEEGMMETSGENVSTELVDN